MTIDEIIKSERIKAEEIKEQINSPEPYVKPSRCLEIAEEHEQIASWLEELKAIKDGAVFYSNRSIEDIVLEARLKAIDEFFLRAVNAYHTDTLDECELCNIERQLKEKK